MAQASSDGGPGGGAGSGARAQRAPRTNLLLSATIEAGALKAPVRIRNMSDNGAMIDGAALPPVGAALTLRRLELEIGATVIWQRSGRCGVRFEGAACVQDWIAGAVTPRSRATPSQLRIDAVQAAPRHEHPVEPDPVNLGEATAGSGTLDDRLAAELAYVRRLLDQVGDVLSDDPIILQRHGPTLQNFDIACQILAQVWTIMVAADRTAAIDAVTMQDLRARLLRKSLF